VATIAAAVPPAAAATATPAITAVETPIPPDAAPAVPAAVPAVLADPDVPPALALAELGSAESALEAVLALSGCVALLARDPVTAADSTAAPHPAPNT